MKRALGLLSCALLLGCSPEGGSKPPPAPPARSAIRLVDVAERAGLVTAQQTGGPDVDYIVDSVGAGAAWLDYDGDGDADLYLAQGASRESPRQGPPDLLLRNDGDPDGDGIPRFTDVTQAAQLGDRLWSFGVATADYDNDGDTDIYLCNWGPNRLYRNDGDGTFTEIGATAGVADERWALSAAWSDVDRDGDLDLYVANYVEFDFARYPARGEKPGKGEPPCTWKGVEIFCGPRNLQGAYDVFYRNDGDPDGDGIPRFTEATRAAGLSTDEPLYGMACRFFDADGDGDDDLYVANDSVRNTFFVNRGDGTFEESATIAGLAYDEQGAEQASMGIGVADYDGDGDFDLAVSSFSHDHDTLYRNEGHDLFTDVSYPSGLGSASFYALSWAMLFVDLDQDGWEDLFVAHGHVYPQVDSRQLGTSFRQLDAVLRNLGDGHFADVTREAGLTQAAGSRAVAPADLDGDGDLDLLVTNLNERPFLLRNEGASGGWLAVRLAGTRSNRDGIGALVRLRAGGREQRRQITRSAPYAASMLPVAHFGLGAATAVERLEVDWPSGRKSVLENVPAQELLVVREPDGG